jgi:hypothetical protein
MPDKEFSDLIFKEPFGDYENGSALVALGRVFSSPACNTTLHEYSQASREVKAPQYVSAGNTQIYTAVYSVPYGNEGCMVDALASRSDEGRVMAAISFGEVPNDL